MDQSTLTGESHPVRKTSEAVLQTDLTRVELPNLVFAGTSVVAGTARAVVVATGMETEFGKIAHLTQSVGEEASPLQQEMAHVTTVVSAIAIGIGLLFFVLALLLAGMSLAESFIFALGMIVAFVPEGLLPTVTLALAMGVQRMARLLPPNGESSRWTVLGDPTEAALCVAALKGGLDLEAEAKQSPRWRELPFESYRKRMSTIHEWSGNGFPLAGAVHRPSQSTPKVAYIKGAPKEVLALCSSIWQDGQACPLTEIWRNQITQANDEFAARGLRVLAVAWRHLPEDMSGYSPESVEQDLTFLGLMAMLDPPRPAPKWPKRCRSATMPGFELL